MIGSKARFILGKSAFVEMRAGQSLYNEGDPMTQVIFPHMGEISISKDRTYRSGLEVLSIGPNGLLGAICAFLLWHRIRPLCGLRVVAVGAGRRGSAQPLSDCGGRLCRRCANLCTTRGSTNIPAAKCRSSTWIA